MAQSSRLLNIVESHSIAGVNKTKIYSELNCNFSLTDKVFIIGGNYDTYDLGIGSGDPYSKYSLGFDVLELGTNYIVIDFDYTGTDLVSAGQTAYISKNYFKKGQFNAGQFNDGVLGTEGSVDVLFNNKTISVGGSHILDAEVNHCIWLNGIWHGGNWKSKTDTYANFDSYKATLTDSGVIVDALTGENENNFGFGYNIFVSGTWMDGYWQNGTVEDILWNNGTFDNGFFKGGTWNNGIKNNGVFSSLNDKVIWNNGIHNNGISTDIYFENGTWNNGTWRGANNISIKEIKIPTIPGYNTTDYIAVVLDDNSKTSFFSVGEELTINTVLVGEEYKYYTSIVENITGDEIIISTTLTATEIDELINGNLDIAKASNSYFKKGYWNNGIWDNGYRRSGFRVNDLSINDTLGGELSFDLVLPQHWLDADVLPTLPLNIGDKIRLTNLVDNLNNRIEEYELEISAVTLGIIPSITVVDVPPSFNGTTVRNSNFEKVFINSTTWEEGTFNSGVWENGYVRKGIFNSTLNSINNNSLSVWKDGQWSYTRLNNLNTHSIWNGGTWNNSVFKYGVWNNGIWNNGYFDNEYLISPISGEDNYSSVWNNGIWNNGIFNQGKWFNGIWNNGTWNDGLITETYTGISFDFPNIEIIDSKQYLRIKFNMAEPFPLPLNIGDEIILNNITDVALTPVALTDSNSDPVNGTTYRIISLFKDNTNDKLFITLNSEQSYGAITETEYLCDITINPMSTNIFVSGDFKSGTWNNGQFINGNMENTTWNNGVFYNGIMNDSIFNNGRFLNGLQENSTFNNGNLEGGLLDSSVLNNGNVFNGEVNATTINNVEFYNGLVRNSIINNGNFYSGDSDNVNMNNGLITGNFNFRNSIMNGGIMDENCTFDSSVKNGGDINNGIIKGDSIHNSGNLFKGEWVNGIWNNGNWDSDRFNSNFFTYEDSGSDTLVKFYSTNNVELLSNTTFPNFTDWVNDPEWTIVSNTAEARIASATPSGTYDLSLTQNSVIGLNNSLSYKINFDIVTNSNPYTGGAFTSPVNRLIIEFDGGAGGSYELPDTSVGNKEFFFTPAGGVGSLDFTFKARILKSAGPDQFISIDNVSVERITSSLTGFTISEEVFTSGLGFKLLPADDLTLLTTKGTVIDNTNNVLQLSFPGNLIIEKINPLQDDVYISNAIWRNGLLNEGTIDGMIFKSGSITYPTMSSSVIEDGVVDYTAITEISNDQISLLTSLGWTITPGWIITSGIAICTPNDDTINYDLALNTLLDIGKYYIINLNIVNNTNYLEDTISILAGDNEYFVSSSEINTYELLVKCETSTNFTIRVKTKNYSNNPSSIVIRDLRVREVRTLELLDNSTWVNGIATGIYLEDSTWVNGQFNAGIMKDSVWNNGTCVFGSFEDCNWREGTFLNGEFKGTDNEIDSINWINGIFLDGVFNCGEIKGGIWDYGFFFDGSISGKTAFYDGAILNGDVKTSKYPMRIFNVSNISSDAEGNNFALSDSVSGSGIIDISANDNFALTPKYPSGSYDATDWGNLEPSYVVNFRPSADWDNDQQKIMFRDIIDYYLNGSTAFTDLYDVDFIVSGNINALLSGDGMTTSANTQSSNNIRITEKNIANRIINKTGTSNINQTISQNGVDEVIWRGGAYIGSPSVTKLTPNTDFRGCTNNGGKIRLTFSDDLTGDLSVDDNFYMTGTGRFNSDCSIPLFKDNIYRVTSITWSGTETLIDTDVDATGVAPGFLPVLEVELYLQAINTNANYEFSSTLLNKKGRYLNIVLTGNHVSKFTVNDEVTFSNITSGSITPYISNNKVYRIKHAELLPGVRTGLTIDVKTNTNLNIAAVDTFNVNVLSTPKGINNLCLGGIGPIIPIV